MIRELVNRVIFDVVNQRDLDRSNRSVDEAADNARDASRQSDRFRASINRLSAGMRRGLAFTNRFGRGIGRLGASLLRSIPLVGTLGVGSFAAFIGAAVNAAGEIEETRDKMRFALGDIADETEAWVRRTSDALGLNRNNVRQFVTDFSLQLQRAVGVAEATDLAQALTQRAFDVESFFNVPVDQVFDAFRAGINGSSEPLDRFNVNIRQSAVDAFALANGLASSSDAITDNIRRVARLRIILNETSNAQGNLAATSQSYTNLLRRFRNTISNTVADIGARFLPSASRILQSLNSQLSANTDRIVAFFDRLAVRVERFINNGGLERIGQLFADIARFAGVAFEATDRFLNISQRERDIESTQNEIRSARNSVNNRRGIAGQIGGTAQNIRASVSGSDRRLAERVVDARRLRQNAVPVTPSLNQSIQVSISGNPNPTEVTRAVQSGVNRGNRSLADVSVLSPVTR